MQQNMLRLSLVLVVFTLAAVAPAAAQHHSAQDHAEWVARSLRAMDTIKVGMTRAELLRMFMEEGGLSTRTRRRYIYRECPYFKVDVEFTPVGESTGPTFSEGSKDKIVKISRPFLEWSIVD
jgi:hypothetical protein